MSPASLLTRSAIAAGVVVLSGATLLAPDAARAATHLRCSASVTPKHPARYSYIDVVVHTTAGAKVRATAHYKSTSTSHSKTADRKGVADLKYYVSGATAGRRVPVSVKVTRKHQTATCSTSFTPR